MAKLFALQSDADDLAGADLPYRVELWDAPDGRPIAVLALGGSPGIGYAAYYAAVSEHFGRHVTLRREDRLLAASGGAG
ncbi:hypothetical protein [Phenylobacterium sp.]|uniref:hypothetical protein n=1 Tax=Phenylobacterium sp. TaxID=1871053 RepID=UPI0028113733|nr:hypothetical protein [Phenylobacterium sp.]